MNTITIEGQLRTGFGKSATRALRSQELVPAVIYGGTAEINFAAPAAAFKNLIYTPNFQYAEVNVDGNTYRTILKDLQFDKVTDKLIHVDLLELVEGKEVVADIPLKFVGASKGVKDGGKFVSKLTAVKVKILPENLRESIEVPIDNLDVNENIRVEDIVSENFEILNSPRIPIASVVMTRQQKQEEAKAPAKGAAPKK